MEYTLPLEGLLSTGFAVQPCLVTGQEVALFVSPGRDPGGAAGPRAGGGLVTVEQRGQVKAGVWPFSGRHGGAV